MARLGAAVRRFPRRGARAARTRRADRPREQLLAQHAPDRRSARARAGVRRGDPLVRGRRDEARPDDLPRGARASGRPRSGALGLRRRPGALLRRGGGDRPADVPDPATGGGARRPPDRPQRTSADRDAGSPCSSPTPSRGGRARPAGSRGTGTPPRRSSPRATPRGSRTSAATDWACSWRARARRTSRAARRRSSSTVSAVSSPRSSAGRLTTTSHPRPMYMNPESTCRSTRYSFVATPTAAPTHTAIEHDGRQRALQHQQAVRRVRAGDQHEDHRVIEALHAGVGDLGPVPQVVGRARRRTGR